MTAVLSKMYEACSMTVLVYPVVSLGSVDFRVMQKVGLRSSMVKTLGCRVKAVGLIRCVKSCLKNAFSRQQSLQRKKSQG